MAKNIIMVSEEDRNMVQRADIEMSSRMNLISFMMSRNMDMDGEKFKRYEQEYQDKFLEFEKAKTYLSNKYLNGINAVSWSLDYESCELTYEQ